MAPSKIGDKNDQDDKRLDLQMASDRNQETPQITQAGIDRSLGAVKEGARARGSIGGCPPYQTLGF